MVDTKKAIKGVVEGKTTSKKKPAKAKEKVKKRVAILGTAGTLKYTPWLDEDLDIFAVGTCVGHKDTRRLDRMIEIHFPRLWEMEADGKVTSKYNHFDCPIYMNDDYTEVFPKCILYPLKEIVEHFKLMELMGIPNRELIPKIFGQQVNVRDKCYFTNSLAYMVALVVYEKEALGKPWEQMEFYGVHMAADSEWAYERACVEYWIARAHASGIRTVIPEDSDLLQSEHFYGYEEDNWLVREIKERTGNVHDEVKKELEATQMQIQKQKFLEGGENVFNWVDKRLGRRR